MIFIIMKKVIRLNETEFREHIEKVTLNEIKTIIGHKLVFPENPERYHKSKFEIQADSNMLTEGLIRSYPMHWVWNYVANRANEDFVNGGINNKKQHVWFVLQPGSKSIEPLKQKMETFGYYCAVEDSVKTGVYLQFEPKFDIYFKGSEFHSRNNNIVFYHVTPNIYKDKILSNGLIPKSKNEYLIYPDRIYLMLAVEGKEKAYDMAGMLYEKDTNELNNGTYSLFGITLTGLNDIKFYPDRNSPEVKAYFTYENIPPQNIVFIEDFDAVDF